MGIYQSWNHRNKSWVKYHFSKERGFHPINVKQRNPSIPFKNIKIKRRR